MGYILVINPNSNQAVTDGLRHALGSYNMEIRCMTLHQGPYGIETQDHIDSVAAPLRRTVEEESGADAFVIACYSDPGLQLCRLATEKPVFGIQESGVLTALARGEKFGVIALGDESIRRHLVYLENMDVTDRLAGERAVDLSVAESASGADTFDRLLKVGTTLRDQDGADVLILGCAGMASHRSGLEQSLNMPVIDPVQAAVEMAIEALG